VSWQAFEITALKYPAIKAMLGVDIGNKLGEKLDQLNDSRQVWQTTRQNKLKSAKLPRYIMQQAMYLPWRGSHFTIMDAGSKTDMVISATDSCS